MGGIVLSYSVSDSSEPLIGVAPIRVDLQLKVAKEKIHISRNERDIREIDGESVDVGLMKTYWYETDEEILSGTRQGFPEVMSMRTKGSFSYDTGIRNGNLMTVITAFGGEHRVKIDNKWGRIKNATTTIEAFDEQTKISWLRKIFGERVLAIESRFDEDDVLQEIYIDSRDSATWSVVHGGNNLTLNNTDDRVFGLIRFSAVNFFIMTRAGFCFDTSAIGTTDNITAASLEGWVINALFDDNDDQAYQVITTSTPASSTDWVTGDWNSFGSGTTTEAITDFIRHENATENATTTWTFNQAGLDWIKKGAGAKTCLGSREGHDVENIPLLNTDGFQNGNLFAGIRSATNRSQVLLVTHEVVVTAFGAEMLMGMTF